MGTYFGLFKQFCNHNNYTGIFLPYHSPKVINCIMKTTLSDNIITCFVVISQSKWLKLENYLNIIIFDLF